MVRYIVGLYGIGTSLVFRVWYIVGVYGTIHS